MLVSASRGRGPLLFKRSNPQPTNFVTSILNLPLTYFVTKIRHQQRCSPTNFDKSVYQRTRSIFFAIFDEQPISIFYSSLHVRCSISHAQMNKNLRCQYAIKTLVSYMTNIGKIANDAIENQSS